MKIVIAPQTFKGSISALEVAKAMSEGVRRVVPDAETDLVPVADGGDGTLETLVETTGGEIRESEVTGPLGHKVVAARGALGDGETAVVEMARSSGLALVPADQRAARHEVDGTGGWAAAVMGGGPVTRGWGPLSPPEGPSPGPPGPRTSNPPHQPPTVVLSP